MEEVSLKEFIERVLSEREKAQVATFNAALREAMQKATEIERRLEALNELRKEVLTDRNQFVNRNELNIRLKSLEDKVDSLRQWQSKIVGYGGGAMAIVGVVSTIVSIILSLYLKQ